jgi:hypothetical protein
MKNETTYTMTYPSIQRPDGSTLVLEPGEEFDETASSPPADAPSVADGPADVTPPAEPAVIPEVPPVAPTA